MNLASALKIMLLFAYIVIASSSSLFAEELLSDQKLLTEPKNKSASVGVAKKGTVELLKKKGFWVKVKAGSIEGWTKRTNVKAKAASGGIASLNTGRSASGNIVSSAGARGLDSEDLINARADVKEFEKLTKLHVTKEEAKKFSSQAGLRSRELRYIKVHQTQSFESDENEI